MRQGDRLRPLWDFDDRSRTRSRSPVYAVAKAFRVLGRPAEAAAQMEQAVAWARENGVEDGWFHEELAEDYAALGRTAEAVDDARLALPLLSEDRDRRERLEQLARA